MAKTRSWSVKGIDGETRDLARAAAQASGMTIGAWIDHAILKAKHGELPSLQPVDVPPEIIAAPATTPPETARPETVQPDLPLSRAPVAPDAGPVAEAPVDKNSNEGDLPAGNTRPERDLVAGNAIAGDAASEIPSTEPRPRVPPPARPSAVRYVLLGIVFAGLLGAGGWAFIELSSPGQTPTPQKIADAAPPVEAPPAPPAASSASTPVAPVSSAAAPAIETVQSPGGLPAGLPDAARGVANKARAGDPKAQYDLGMLYLSGRLGDRNPTEAAKWFERAAAQGVATAQFSLGVLYQRGEGVVQNDKQAFVWYQSAAELNFPQAQHNLATAYSEGKGTAQSFPKAAEWFAKSAGAGLSQSQYSLGALHERGLITGQPNVVEARRWYERALAQGDTRASVRLAVLDAPKLPIDASSAGSATTTPVAALGRAEIRQIQALLNRMNFNPGPADGQMGKRTADAIRLYQKFAGMDEDGAPSTELLEDLRAVAETMSKGG